MTDPVSESNAVLSITTRAVTRFTYFRHKGGAFVVLHVGLASTAAPQLEEVGVSPKTKATAVDTETNCPVKKRSAATSVSCGTLNFVRGSGLRAYFT